MSQEISHDPRDRLVREKYFSLRPKPLERWLWQQGLPQAAERVFWLHWEEGMRNRDWCSQVPLKRVASLCCIDPSTVPRAYQLLKTLSLIRREDPGRDPVNPFQQATAVTEVRIPRELLTELSRSPNDFARAIPVLRERYAAISPFSRSRPTVAPRSRVGCGQGTMVTRCETASSARLLQTTPGHQRVWNRYAGCATPDAGPHCVHVAGFYSWTWRSS